MVDLIEFPAHKVQPDAFPEPGDAYQAYGLAHHVEPVSLTFVFRNWSMISLPYNRLSRLRFRFLGDAADGNGEGVLSVMFGQGQGDAIGIAITGRRLYQAGYRAGQRRMHWFWERPEGQAVSADAPVVHSIAVQEGDARSVYAWLFKE